MGVCYSGKLIPPTRREANSELIGLVQLPTCASNANPFLVVLGCLMPTAAIGINSDPLQRISLLPSGK